MARPSVEVRFRMRLGWRRALTLEVNSVRGRCDPSLVREQQLCPAKRRSSPPSSPDFIKADWGLPPDRRGGPRKGHCHRLARLYLGWPPTRISRRRRYRKTYVSPFPSFPNPSILTSFVISSVWDTRSLKKPLFTAANLPSLNAETNLVFSPDERYILTGTAGAHAGVLAGSAEEEKAKELEKAGGESGKVVVLMKEGLEVVRSLSAFSFSSVSSFSLSLLFLTLSSEQTSLHSPSSKSSGTPKSTKSVPSPSSPHPP